MKGHIVLWYGAIAYLPAAWQICDGTNGTPDLRNRFVIGAGDSYAVGATGGSTTHTHPFTANAHNHTIGAGGDIAATPAGWSNTFGTAYVTGVTGIAATRAPFKALTYIQKL